MVSVKQRCRIENTAIIMAAAAAATPHTRHQPYPQSYRSNTRSRRMSNPSSLRRPRTSKTGRHATPSSPMLPYLMSVDLDAIAAASHVQMLHREACASLAIYSEAGKEDVSGGGAVGSAWRHLVPLPDGGRKRRLLMKAVRACYTRVMGQTNTARTSPTLQPSWNTDAHQYMGAVKEVLALDTFLFVRGPPKLLEDDAVSTKPSISLDLFQGFVADAKYGQSCLGDSDDEVEELNDDEEEQQDDDILDDMLVDEDYSYGEYSPYGEQDFISDEEEDDDDEDYCLARQTPRSSSATTVHAATSELAWTSPKMQPVQDRTPAMKLCDARCDMAKNCGAARTWQARQAYSLVALRARYDASVSASATTSRAPLSPCSPPRDPFGLCPPVDDAARLRKMAQQRAYAPYDDAMAPLPRGRRGRETSGRWLMTAIETHMTRIGKITGPLRPRAMTGARSDVWNAGRTASPLRCSVSPEAITTTRTESCEQQLASDLDFDGMDIDAFYKEAYLLHAAAAASALETNAMPMSTESITAELVDLEAAFAEMDQLFAPMALGAMEAGVVQSMKGMNGGDVVRLVQSA